MKILWILIGLIIAGMIVFPVFGLIIVASIFLYSLGGKLDQLEELEELEDSDD